MKRLFVRFVLPVLFIIAGIVLLVLNINTIKSGKNFIQTTATITAIREEYNAAREEYDHDVEVNYTYEGKEYTSLLGEYRSSYKVGNEVAVKVNPADPAEVRPASDAGLIIGIVMAVVAILAGILTFLKGMVNR